MAGERANFTVRMANRRYTRLTNAFSKKLENHAHMCALTFMHYNFCKRHSTKHRQRSLLASRPTSGRWKNLS